MSEFAKQAYERYRESVKVQRDLAETIAAENREATPEELQQFERQDEDINRYKGAADQAKEIEDRSKEVESIRADFEPILHQVAKANATVDDATRIFSMFKQVRDTGAAGGFDSYLSNRALAVGNFPGSAIPVSFIDQVTVYARTLSPMLDSNVVTMYESADGHPITLPRLTADAANGGTVTAEAALATLADPTISKVQLNPYKYTLINVWSAELGQDNAIGLQDLIARTTGRELALDAGADLTTANGSSKPNGFINAATNGGTASGTANNTFFGPADIVDLFYGGAAPYRQVGVWQASNTGLAKIRKLADSTGQFLWQASLAPGQPESLMGRPIYENPAMAAVASGSLSVAFGDFKAYWVHRVNPVRVELSRDFKFQADQLALKVVERIDGDLIDTAAVRYLVSAAA